MVDSNIVKGNGLMLYLRTKNLDEIYKKVKSLDWSIEEEIHLNERPMKKEFALRDPDGYYLTISEYHEFKG